MNNTNIITHTHTHTQATLRPHIHTEPGLATTATTQHSGQRFHLLNYGAIQQKTISMDSEAGRNHFFRQKPDWPKTEEPFGEPLLQTETRLAKD